MSLAADAMQPFTVRGLTALRGRPSGMTISDLIGRQKIVGYDLDFDVANQTIQADFRGPEAIVDSIASDSIRFASAAFQTVNTVSKDIVDKHGIAWSLVRMYYSAFYGGHALIRLLGESCSFFDRSHIARISALGFALGKIPGFRLEAAAHRCLVNSSATVITCRSLRGGTGGAHESFWSMFGARLKYVSEELLKGPLPPGEAQLVFAKVNDLLRSLSGHRAPLHSWLSIIRNDVQYRHHFGVWLPCEVSKKDREQLGRLAEQWKRDPMDIDVGLTHAGPLGEFVVSCALIIALCRVLLTRISERSTEGGRSFITSGMLRYEAN